MIRHNPLVLIVLMSCWAVAASPVVDETDAGVTVCVAEITSMCGFGSDGVVVLLSAGRSMRCLSRVYILRTPSTRQDISVGYFVLPGYDQDTAHVSQVESVEPSLLPGIRSPRLAAIQQYAGKTGWQAL